MPRGVVIRQERAHWLERAVEVGGLLAGSERDVVALVLKGYHEDVPNVLQRCRGGLLCYSGAHTDTERDAASDCNAQQFGSVRPEGGPDCLMVHRSDLPLLDVFCFAPTPLGTSHRAAIRPSRSSTG